MLRLMLDLKSSNTDTPTNTGGTGASNTSTTSSSGDVSSIPNGQAYTRHFR